MSGGRALRSSIAFSGRPSWTRAALSARLQSIGDAIEHWLDIERDQLVLWLPVALSIGIAAWFVFPLHTQWIAFIAAMLSLSAAGWLLPRSGRAGRCLSLFGLVAAIGCALIWWRAGQMAVMPISGTRIATFEARIEKIELLPARGDVRLTLLPVSGSGLPERIRVNLDADRAGAGIAPDATIRLRARLLPPAEPALPGGYDFARVAWFMGIGATGRVLDPPKLIRPAAAHGGFMRWIDAARARLTAHIEHSLAPSGAGIAAAMVTGDVGAISDSDQDAMRRSGLAHLLSISGLHVAVVIGGTILIAMRLLSLSPALALRFRLPLIAAATGALAGIAYTLISGAEVPTMRSCIAALLVLAGMMLGRQAMTLRLVATAAFLLLLWRPEALIGPSFQLSFTAVIALVAFHEHPRMRALFLKRDEGWGMKMLREGASIFLTGIIVELALAPIALFHFQRTGLFGAFANMLAIPLTSFVIMPLEALALFFDIAGFGAPFWWLTGQSIALLLAIARHVAAWPGAVIPLPSMPAAAFALMTLGGGWTCLWRSRLRWVGLAPFCAGAAWAVSTRAPDLLVTGDGRHVALRDGDRLAILRPRAHDYVRGVLKEAAGNLDEPVDLDRMPLARCNADACVAVSQAGPQPLRLLATRSAYHLDAGELVRACANMDVVISDRRLPRACSPHWLKIDRIMLRQTGGLAIRLSDGAVRTVRLPVDDHPWLAGSRRY